MSSIVPEDYEVWRIQFKDELSGRSYIAEEIGWVVAGLSALIGIEVETGVRKRGFPLR
jgi:hypothetical protein